MKTKMSAVFLKMASCFALLLTIANVNSTCYAIVHQPKIPDIAMRYKK